MTSPSHDVAEATRPIVIGGREVGPGRPVYVIAELSANHRQSQEHALELVRAAAAAGADAVKLQTYTPDTITLDSDAPPFRHGEGSLWSGQTLHDLYREAYMPWEWQPGIIELANELGLHCFSSPFDPTAVEFLDKLDVPALKIASFELVDLPLIRAAAATGRPLIISTGMATLEEVDESVDAARGAGAGDIAILKCTSAYPAPPDQLHLRAIGLLERRYRVPIGLSDHTRGIVAAVAAVAMGATIVEKHFTISRADPSPDSAFSLESDEFAAMVQGIRTAEAALGEERVAPTADETESRRFRRSLFVVADVGAGEPLTHENVRSVRPAAGLHTRYLEAVMGRRASRDLPRGTPLAWDVMEGGEEPVP